MNRIKILAKSLAQKIAAGEVVERPASVVKELLENSIDAGSSFITVEITNGGKDLIRISDNGSGVDSNDVELAFFRHATSKIETEEDLYNISNLGFRGEALYSISAVSKTTMLTKTFDSDNGKKIAVHGGEIVECTEAGCPNGTTVIVENLFYNTPARKKFMKSNSSETSQIASIVQKIILSRPDISIKLIVNSELIYQSNGDGSLINAIYSIYGKHIANNVYGFDVCENGIRIYGALGKKDILRNSRINETIFVNSRYIKSTELNRSIESAYGSLLMKGKFPFYVVFVEVDSAEVDVNVHPQKLMVKFSNQKEIESAIYQAIKSVSDKIGALPDMLISEADTEIAIEPVRRALDFEKHSAYGFSESNTNETIAEEQPHYIEEIINEPKKYDYKRELELKKAMAAPLSLKQSSSIINYEQKSYLDEAAGSKILGVAFDSYIVVESSDELYLIDQHAAHERLLFEKYYKHYLSSKVATQSLLISQDIDITFEEKQILTENMTIFNKLGFIFSDIRNDLVKLISVPHILGQPKFKSFFVEVFDLLSENKFDDENSIIIKLISMSCKKAVKAGDKLSNEEINQLLMNIKNEDIPLTCPHGRPFVMKITKYQIDKKVGRIQ